MTLILTAGFHDNLGNGKPSWILLEDEMTEVTTGSFIHSKLQSNHKHQYNNAQFLHDGCPSRRKMDNCQPFKAYHLYLVVLPPTG